MFATLYYRICFSSEFGKLLFRTKSVFCDEIFYAFE